MCFASAGYARVAIHARYILLRSDLTRVAVFGAGSNALISGRSANA